MLAEPLEQQDPLAWQGQALKAAMQQRTSETAPDRILRREKL
ncbi:Conserved hypothetical protein [Prochlorococcus marinus str. MIT 9313]|uniref:Uncharacterized protein n=1 Tax=Prochlorococcus marinus (strain MIT 9313) TaxID=74547 RepID=B9ES62_PROMM|nr:Conserved hypothetical protein [Prochlorococcus marinus str. MIT 9313]